MAQRKNNWGFYNQDFNFSREEDKTPELPNEIREFAGLCDYYSKIQQDEAATLPQNTSMIPALSANRNDFTDLPVIPSTWGSQFSNNTLQEYLHQAKKPSMTFTPELPQSIWSNCPQLPNQYEPLDLSPRNAQKTLNELREIRQDNLMKLWAVQTITNEQSDANIDRASSMTNETQVVRYNKNNERLCYFCMKKGELPNVYEQHNFKDLSGNIICPAMKQKSCEICGATGAHVHLKENCPYASLNDNMFKF